MHHVFFLDGNAKKISWIIQTNDSIIEQNREHVEIYKDKITNLQSKYVSLHVGLFWGIGAFIIKNQDNIKIKVDDITMYKNFTTDKIIEDEFIKKRQRFIEHLIQQRKLKIDFELINNDKNLAAKII